MTNRTSADRARILERIEVRAAKRARVLATRKPALPRGHDRACQCGGCRAYYDREIPARVLALLRTKRKLRIAEACKVLERLQGDEFDDVMMHFLSRVRRAATRPSE